MNEDIIKFLEKTVDPLSEDLTQFKVVFYRGNYFEEDLTDRLTPGDGITVIEDENGKRFKANRRAFPFGVLEIKDANDSTLPPIDQRTPGDAYIVFGGATGEFASFVEQVVIWTVWDEFFPLTPTLGTQVYVKQTDTFWYWNDQIWKEIPNIANGIPAEGLDIAGWYGVELEIEDPNFVPPTPNTYYLVGGDPNTGQALAGRYAANQGDILHFTSASSYVYIPKKEGMAVKISNNDLLKVFENGNWVTFTRESSYRYRYRGFIGDNTYIKNNWTRKSYNGFPGLKNS